MPQAKLKKIPVKSREQHEKEHPGEIMHEHDLLSLPNFRANEKQIPEVKKWETGKNYRLIIDIKQTGKHEEREEPVRAEFDIVGYKVVSNKTVNDEIIKKD